ncbi:DUF4139 domain-containing protein [Marinagarivorans algicola]|uniref:DUF4139 domain-containing protein n=1 Tax=Marinagarivorans algicola TaxID=1513270 RepID=UPI0006B491E2|nr:DUF4139 domain-containing protein [Marinagarivorans algicola]
MLMTPKAFTRLSAPIALAALLANHSYAADSTINSQLQDQTGLAVTIYNGNLALVKDQRRLNIPKGEHDVAFMGVSALIKPQTALLRNTQDANAIKVLEQNFDFDLLSPQKLLEKSLGKTIKIARTNPATGKETLQNAEVLSTNEGVIVKIGDTLETNPQGRFIFDELPPNLRAQPTLTNTLRNNRSGAQTYELSYLTQGLNWQADYVAEITSSNTLDLASWVTLTNNSNTEYRDAKIQLIAGDVNQVQPQQQRPMMMASRALNELEDATPAEDLMEYKLYTLPRKTTLANAQTKQVSLFNASNVQSLQKLIFNASTISRYNKDQQSQSLKPTVELHVTNSKKANLGLALPKGIVRVYQRDSQGNAQFVGEDSINHTAENDTLKLTLGKSFDVGAKRSQTAFNILEQNNRQTITYSTSYNVEFTNAKAEPVTVSYVESFSGEWELTHNSLKPHNTAAYQATWQITIPAKGSTNLSFTAKVKQ